MLASLLHKKDIDGFILRLVPLCHCHLPSWRNGRIAGDPGSPLSRMKQPEVMPSPRRHHRRHHRLFQYSAEQLRKINMEFGMDADRPPVPLDRQLIVAERAPLLGAIRQAVAIQDPGAMAPMSSLQDDMKTNRV